MIDPRTLYRNPNALAPHYSQFRVADRLLLTGHSHQAWPDRGFEGQQLAWLDAAEFVDDKWERAFTVADRVRRGFARLMDDSSGNYALGASTHDLLLRFLSALPLRERPHLITTDGEFHSIRRQLDRLAEEGIRVTKVAATPPRTITDRLAAALTGDTAAVLVSKVFFENAQIVPNLGNLMEACQAFGAILLVDVYHALNAIPFSIEEEGLTDAFVTGGGYKYCQLGEGNCFLRFPANCSLRPVITGWFSEFDALEMGSEQVVYGKGAARFAGATYDPTSHYRASAVFDFFEEMDLNPALLRQVSQHQVGLLIDLFDSLDPDPRFLRRDRSIALNQLAGFLALHSPQAHEIQMELKERGVSADFRKDTLRLGPAPYLSDDQLKRSMDILGEVILQLGPTSRLRTH